MKKRFTILIAAIAAIMLITQPTKVWAQRTAPDLSAMIWSTPIVDENFNSATVAMASTTHNPGITNYTAIGEFNCVYNNNSKNKYGIEDNTTLSSKALKLYAGSGSPVITAISGPSYSTKGAYSFKITKASKCYIGLFNETISGSAHAKAKATAYLQQNAGALSICDGNSWVSVGSFTSTDVLEICVIYNSTNSATSYGNSVSLGAKKAHIYVNGSCVMNGENPKEFTIPGCAALGFRVSPLATSGNVAIVDDVKVYDELPAAGGSITYSATNGSIAGENVTTSAAVNSGAILTQGTVVTLTATPSSGYSLSSWSVSGAGSTLSSTSTNPTTFTMGTENATVTANFIVASVCSAPTFTVAEGTYNAAQSVELNCLTDGATIYYTTDGTNPTTSSTVYSSAIAVNVSKTIKAFAVKAGLENSSIASATYTLKCATPTITVPEGIFLDTKTVTMESASAGVSIYYTTNGSTPTSSSTAYDPSNKPTISATTTFKAIAIKDGWTDSDIATETFTKITPLTVASALTAIDALADNGTIADQYVAGKISQIDGYSSNSITYWISDDGTTSSQLEVYKGKGLNGANFSAETDLTVGEIVVVNGTLKKYVYSSTTTPEFTNGNQLVAITHKVKTPTFSPAAGAVAADTKVTISTTTEGATIYYTTDDSTPTQESIVYSTPIPVNAAMTIKAFAIKDDYIDSSVSEAAYTIALPCATPTFSVAEGEVEKGTSVTLSTETVGATIYYTTNGSTPTTSSTAYSSAITINSAMTIKAIAAKDGMANSEVASAAYTVRDYVFLPFAWAGGVKNDLANVTGITTIGLGSDYAPTNAPYRVKMDDAGDYITIKTDSKPAMVTIGVKMIGGATTSKIKVKESADGSSFTDVEELTISGSANDVLNLKTSNSFAATTRYVKIIKSVHASGGNIGVGPITIDMSGSQTFTDFTIPANNTITIVSGSVLTVTGTLTISGTLVIEDGGQLVCSTSVAATVQKSITSAAGKGEADNHWYSISSPVHDGTYNTVALSNVTNLVSSATPGFKYDMLAYDETKHEWVNQKEGGGASGFNVMNKGQGYIYRNSGELLSFVGNTNVGAIDCPLSFTSSLDIGGLKGLNLIGNPYTHSVTKDSEKAIDDSHLSVGFYEMTNVGGWTAHDDGEEILPKQGILVKTSAAVAGFQIKDVNYEAPAKDKAGNDKIKFIVSNSRYEDVAYAKFCKGLGLNKIDHRNTDIPMIYINQGDENYAIATMDDDTKSFSLCFKAKKTAQYTLSCEANGNYSYLHIIDRFTGDDVDMLIDGKYTFIGTPQEAANRFIVRLDYKDGSDTPENGSFVYQSGSDIIVNGNGELQIFDVMGRMVSTQRVSGMSTINMQTTGIYIFRLVGDGLKTQKIVVK